MSGLFNVLYDVYVRFLVWLGAAPPAGYEYLLPMDEASPREYTVKKGETIFAVARKFGVHYDLIAQANGIEDPETVQPGQTLIIPPPDWDPDSGPLVERPPKPVPEQEPEPPVELQPTPEEAPPVALKPTPEPIDEPSITPPEELEFEELDWLASTQETSTLLFDAEEPVLLPDELDTSDEAPSDEAPQWLLAVEPTEPAPEFYAENVMTAVEAPTFSDRLEWLVATEPPQPKKEVFSTPAKQLPPSEKAPSKPVAPTAKSPALVPPELITDQEMLFRYEVQRGDTLSSIAKRYGVTVKELIEANDVADPNRIFPGQKLIIPGYMAPKTPPEPEPRPEPPLPTPDESFIYTVAEGDTLSGIAKRYGVTVRQLVEANNIDNSNLIRVGQRLFIPGVLKPPETQPEEQPEPRPQPEPAPVSVPSAGIDPDSPPLGPVDAVRALYVSYFAIGHADFRKRIFELLDTTELNAVVIDAKGDYGWISYPSRVPLAHEIDAARPTAKDFDEVMAQFKKRGLYTIARVVTFKDNPLAKNHPELAIKIEGANDKIWQDRENLSWSDPFLKPVWDYNIKIAIEAAQKGFDEIQFDYIRFPTSSQAGTPQFSQETTKETRLAAITGFLSAVRGQLQPFGVKVAADTFGYTCWRKDDTLIGQDIERMGQYLDVLCPMLYPSTFGSGIPGYKFAIAHPYEIVYQSATRAIERVREFGCVVRPWIQDFQDYRFDKRIYGKEEIQAQIKGCFDAGSAGFMVWDPHVRYTDGAYAPAANRP
ncbi:MAG: LysM peptidoglycan-binding domain-containing protein [Anaerolineae bacterium]|nr:LysM peptidoglycan-binding domain-containing protein [Anaerolineae bacterium]